LPAAKRFFRKASERHGRPDRVVIDGSQTNQEAIASCDTTNQLQDRCRRLLKPIRIRQSQYVLDGLRGEESIAALCRREGIAESLQLVEAAGDTAHAATADEVKVLRKETRDLKEVVAEQALELRLLKKSMIADGGDDE
jgi:transposase